MDKEKFLAFWGLSGDEGERVWADKQRMHQGAFSSAMVTNDITPYRSTQTGEYIGSRSSHRAHLKQHGLIEVGNEKMQPKPSEIHNKQDRESLRREIARHVYNH